MINYSVLSHKIRVEILFRISSAVMKKSKSTWKLRMLTSNWKKCQKLDHRSSKLWRIILRWAHRQARSQWSLQNPSLTCMNQWWEHFKQSVTPLSLKSQTGLISWTWIQRGKSQAVSPPSSASKISSENWPRSHRSSSVSKLQRTNS